MTKIKNSALELIGNTPLLRLNSYCDKKDITVHNIYAKLEGLNPAGSAKDRAALYMIKDAEEKGLL